MGIFKIKLIVFTALFALVSSIPASYSFCDIEFAQIHSLAGGRAVEDLNEVKIGTYNVLNLEFSPGRYVDNPKTGAREFVPGKITKDREQLEGVARAIKEENLDMIVLQEVEGISPLINFNKKYLNDEYEVLLQRGNDGRGIEIGFLIKKDLPFDIRAQSHIHRSWKNPQTGKEELIFSRDLPALHIRRKTTSMNDPPDMIFAGVHYKSQRKRKGDPRSENLRRRQVEETKSIIQKYEEVYPGVPIFLGGDFNADLHRHPEFAALFEKEFMTDSFDLGKKNLNPQDRVTHTFHPRNGPVEKNQLDAILVNESASAAILEAKVHRYKDVNGVEKPLPSSYQERELNPSDHFLVVVKARLSHLFGAK